MLVSLLSQKVDIEETLDLLALRTDAKEWLELEDVLAETVELDYRSLFGGITETLPRNEVISRWKTLLASMKTQHIITNLSITVKMESIADCAANVMATHVRTRNGDAMMYTIGGRYDFQLLRDEGRWKVSSIKLTVLWTTGTPDVLKPRKT